ncbi:CpsD/CapB family tyrosine-protein kinase [Paenibacillus chartarius]|uniref:CpsD/CapB family tyrosine-protein kinase n=1 Tax=Paenibacillus chartarius TaxID=747481 RepID=A0ABV6DUV3_9BACL
MRQRADNDYLSLRQVAESEHAEIYRTLRFNLECLMAEQELTTIAVASANQAEGKTTTIVNLGRAFAKTGKRVLLLDANLRSPKLHRLLGSTDERNVRPGLVNILHGQCTIQEAIGLTELEGLHVLPAGQSARDSFEMLSKSVVDRLLSGLKGSYDIILADTCASLAYTEGRIIAACCDGVLLVVAQGKLKRAAAEKLNDQLLQNKANILGIVLSQANPKEI